MNIRLDNGHILRARLRNEKGEWVDSEIDLNDCLGNDDGKFECNGADFLQTATNIKLELGGSDRIDLILRAVLTDGVGNKKEADINLGDHIENIDGRLVFN
jgi:hypothetical protein